MAGTITDAMSNQFKQDLFDGVHQPGDDYRVVLLKPLASLVGSYDAASTYTNVTTNGDEIAAGGGYSTGGMSLSGRASSLAAGVAYLDFADLAIASSTISAAGIMIINATRSNKALGVWNLRDGSGNPATITSTNATFTVNIPRSGNGVLSIS